MKPKVHIISPRYEFGPEHDATVKISVDGCHLSAQPFDVSKGNLSVIMAEEPKLMLGALVDVITVSAGDKEYKLENMTVKGLVADDEKKQFKIVFSCDIDDRESHAQVWQLGYFLRSIIRTEDVVIYDEKTLPKVPARGLYTEEARQERLSFVREKTGVSLSEVENTTLDPKALVSNIEALIGSVEIPVGVAGPLHIKGEYANGLYYAPMATSEGALLASATRGATAISRSGGVTTRVLAQRMLRVPVFVLSDLSAAFFFSEWVKDHFNEISNQTKKYSNYADLLEIETHVLGRTVHVRFIYETGDAAGQNMTTTCTWQACQWIIGEMSRFDDIEFENFMIESNLSNDKKVTLQSFLKGRGVRVLSECVLSREDCEQVLKVTPQQLYSAFNSFVGGSVAAGMVGININIANVIAAIFTATGQDIACVHESSIGQLHMELVDDDAIYATLMLPSLVVGSVGGGTNLPQQRECLEMINSAGPGGVKRLAEVICGYCLALDLSTLSAIASDQFARAHEKLGRNRPVNWLKLGDLDVDFFASVMKDSLERDALTVSSVEERNVENMGSSIITELTAHKINKLVGHFPFLIGVDNGSDIEVMVKVKPLDDEVILMLNSMAAMCDARLAQSYNKFKGEIGFKGCHIKELEVMSQTDERFTRYAPKVYGTLADASREAYIIVEEHLENMVLMDSADDTSEWKSKHIKAALSGIAEVHSIWYGKADELNSKEWMTDAPTRNSMMEKIRLWELLGAHARDEFPEWFTEDDMEVHRKVVYTMVDWYGEMDAMPKTLIHNDFNPRNIAFREVDGELILCAYDWELATVNLPQHDLAEFLVFTLGSDVTEDEVTEYVEFHRKALEKAAGTSIDEVQWRKGYRLCLFDLLLNRIPMYVMAHTFRHYGFMGRVVNTFRKLLEIEKVRGK